MHDAAEHAEASQLLTGHWDRGTKLATLPAALRPTTRRDGYAIQALLEARSTSPLFGWKIAATSLNGQKHINVGGPLAGRILAERVAADGSAVSLTGNLMRVAEAEFAFRFARDLPPAPRPYASRRFSTPSRRCIRRSNCRTRGLPISPLPARPT